MTWRTLSFRVLHFSGSSGLPVKHPNTNPQNIRRCLTTASATPSSRKGSLLLPRPFMSTDVVSTRSRSSARVLETYARLFSRAQSTSTSVPKTVSSKENAVKPAEPSPSTDNLEQQQLQDLLSSQYVALQLTPKLKPHIVKRRLKRMRVYEGAEKNIRHSPWRLNLVCQLAAGLPLPTALTQLEFCKKWAAPLVQKVLRRTSNLADIRDGLQPSQLEVAECFATKGSHLKRLKTMGRGRMGRMEHKFSHMRVVLREIDFKLKVYQAPTINQKKRWLQLQLQAQRDGDRAQAEREELERLEKQAESVAASKNKE
jgi:large subunit ribosomal protein L22